MSTLSMGFDWNCLIILLFRHVSLLIQLLGFILIDFGRIYASNKYLFGDLRISASTDVSETFVEARPTRFIKQQFYKCYHYPYLQNIYPFTRPYVGRISYKSSMVAG